MLYFIAAAVLLLVVAVVRQLMQQPVRRIAGRRARPGGAGPVPGLRPGQRQDRRLRGRGRARRHRRRAVRARSSGSSRPRCRRRAVHRVPDRRRDRRPHHAAGPGAGRHRRGLGADRLLRTFPSAGSTPRACCSSWSSASSRPAWPASAPWSTAGARRAKRSAPEPEPDPDPDPELEKAGCTVMTSRTGAAGRRQRRHGHRIPRSPRPDGRFRRVHGGQRRRSDAVPGRPALPDRTQRCRQNDPHRRHHRTGAGDRIGEQVAARNCSGKKVHQIARLGVGRTFQTASVFEQLTVLQNLDIAAGAGRSCVDAAAAPVRRAARRSRRPWTPSV